MLTYGFKNLFTTISTASIMISATRAVYPTVAKLLPLMSLISMTILIAPRTSPSLASWHVIQFVTPNADALKGMVIRRVLLVAVSVISSIVLPLLSTLLSMSSRAISLLKPSPYCSITFGERAIQSALTFSILSIWLRK